MVEQPGSGLGKKRGLAHRLEDRFIITHMRAYSYIRFSSMRQADGDSLRRQTAKASEYAAAHGLELDERFTYRDLGVPAYDRSNLERGALGLFLKAVQDGKVPRGSVLLVEAFDRLTRSPPLVAVNLLSDILRAGITIITLRDKKKYTEESLNSSLADLMMSVVLLMAAHEEVKHRAERVRDYYKARRDAHLPVVGATGPGWLKKMPEFSGWELIPERAESVRKVFDLGAAGLGGVAIMRKANGEGWPVPSRVQKGWHHSNILKLLKNRAVLGEYQPMTNLDGKLVPIGDPWPNYFPQLIDEETFLRVQAVRSRCTFGTGKRATSYRNIFNGLLRCGTCGATLTLHNTRSGSDINYMYFRCVDSARNLSDCQSFRTAEIFRNLLPALLLHVRDAVLIADRVQELRDQLDTESARLVDARQAQVKLLAMFEGGSEASGSGSESLDRLLRERLRSVSLDVDKLETNCMKLKAQLEDATSVWDDEDNEATITDAIDAVFDPAKEVERSRLHDRLSRAIEHLWLYAGIAAMKRIGENCIRWLSLDPAAVNLIENPPPIPPIRKHHKAIANK